MVLILSVAKLCRSKSLTALSGLTSTTTPCTGGRNAAPWSCWATFALADSSWQTPQLTLQRLSPRWHRVPQAVQRWTMLLHISSECFPGLNLDPNSSDNYAQMSNDPATWKMEFQSFCSRTAMIGVCMHTALGVKSQGLFKLTNCEPSRQRPAVLITQWLLNL
jgi:hypothetical protein